MILLDKKFKGAALIMALFVTAIIASISAGLFSMVSMNIENEKNMLSEQQAIVTTLSLESFTKKYLTQKENRTNLVLTANNFNQKSPINLPLERGNLEANIVDMGQCFNLNSLILISATGEEIANTDNLDFFKNLMKSLFIEEQKIEEITPAIVDWLDKDSFPDTYLGVEDDFYKNEKISRLSSNQFFYDITELRDIKGVTEEIFQKLKPYVCVINSLNTKININSLNPFYPNILVALSSNTLSDLEARNILNNKPLAGYSSVTNFLNLPEIKTSFSSKFSKANLVLETNYFILNTNIKIDDKDFHIKSHIYYSNESPKVIRRKLGEYL
ncbi:MAG: general secretion pathway protein GspK [Gammaproteobacteria bacterium]|jgi:general secretion pathway protein K|nr:MAG: general secretion pathway protein GspK [Gammaproteobacteria bacterium]